MDEGVHQVDETSWYEFQYFPWRCAICKQIAIRPGYIQGQELTTFSPYKDINGEVWIRCDHCLKKFHAHCLNITGKSKAEWNCVVCRLEKLEKLVPDNKVYIYFYCWCF
jgi:hypothetical protein